MRVALDARTLQDAVPGGVGRTLRRLVPLLAEQVDLVALTDARLPAAPDLPVTQHALRGPLTGRGASWLQLAAPRFLRGFDGLFHCPFYGLPYRQPVPMVVTIHDVTFEEHPEWFPAAQRTAFRAQARCAARTARRIITVSAHEAAQLRQVYGIEPDRIVIAPNAVDDVFHPQAAPGWLRGRRYVVALGGAPRRGLDRAIAAWRAVRSEHPDVDLVVVGHEVPALEEGLVAAGALDDPTWAAVLAGAAALCYPTQHEGFGMPALEACASGTPVVCARVGALPEVLGPAAQWCDEPSATAIAEGLTTVLDDEQRAGELRAAGLARAAAAPGWSAIAQRYVAAYQEALAGA